MKKINKKKNKIDNLQGMCNAICNVGMLGFVTTFIISLTNWMLQYYPEVPGFLRFLWLIGSIVIIFKVAMENWGIVK